MRQFENFKMGRSSYHLKIRFLPIKCSTERFNKDYLAKTPRPQRKTVSYFSELGVLCAFARCLAYPIP